VRVIRKYNGQPLDEKSDEELLKLGVAGKNHLVWAVLYKRYAHLLTGVALKYLGNEQEAYDAVMDVFEKLISHPKKDIENFKNWIYVNLKNHCLMIIRHKKVEDKYLRYLEKNNHIFMDLGIDNHHNDEEKEEKFRLMLNFINHLSEEQHMCIDAFYLQNKGYQQIADENGYSLKQVKSFIQNGKRNLKLKMEKQYDNVR